MNDKHKSADGNPPRRLRALRDSLRFRILGLVFAIVAATVLALSLFALKRFEEASVLQLEHEALVLSDVLESAVAPLLAAGPDREALQALIDRISSNREKNDIEINVILLKGHRSSIVASNIPDNIERSSVYEHRDMLAALEKNEPIVFVGKDSDEARPLIPPHTSPDFYLRPGERFLSVTTPLVEGGQKIGSINTKLSLTQLDRQLAAIRAALVWMSLALPITAFLLVFWAVQRGLRPLDRLAGEVAQVQSSSLGHRFSPDGTPSELRPVIERLNELLERLQTAFEREQRFTANVAHELRTPIATLKVLAEVGLQEEASGRSPHSDATAFCSDVLAISRQMEQLVVNLLGLVRSESGTQEVNIGRVDLGRCIEAAWEAYAPEAQGRGIQSEFRLDPEALVQSDETLLGAILRNLFSNAVTYAKSEGSIHCTLEKNDARFHLIVSNTNDGLTRGDLQHLFEPFWRKEASRSDDSHCGIGLSLVQAYSKLLEIGIEARLPNPDTVQIVLRIPTSVQESESA